MVQNEKVYIRPKSKLTPEVVKVMPSSNTPLDCTLISEGQYFNAHKAVLSAYSPYLESELRGRQEDHPMVFLERVKPAALENILEYVYRGQARVPESQAEDFLRAAEQLQIQVKPGMDGPPSPLPPPPSSSLEPPQPRGKAPPSKNLFRRLTSSLETKMRGHGKDRKKQMTNMEDTFASSSTKYPDEIEVTKEDNKKQIEPLKIENAITKAPLQDPNIFLDETITKEPYGYDPTEFEPISEKLFRPYRKAVTKAANPERIENSKPRSFVVQPVHARTLEADRNKVSVAVQTSEPEQEAQSPDGKETPGSRDQLECKGCRRKTGCSNTHWRPADVLGILAMAAMGSALLTPKFENK